MKSFLIKSMSGISSGTRAYSGEPWQSQNLQLEWREQSENGLQVVNRVSATAFNGTVEALQKAGVKPGQKIKAELIFNVHSAGVGRYVNNVVKLQNFELC